MLNLTSNINGLSLNLEPKNLVPRKTLTTPHPHAQLLREIILKPGKFCFVTGGNDKYFSLLYECILSLLACKSFAPCPVYVSDDGLSTENSQRLKRLSERIQIIDVTKFFAGKGIVLNEENKHLGSIIFRGFFRELFPDHDYCFYIDADAWIQDESGIFDYIALAKEQGIAVPAHPFNTRVTRASLWLNRNTITPEQIPAVIGFPAIILCCCCVNTNSILYREYQDCLTANIKKLGVKWGIDQETLLYIAAKNKLKILPTEYAYEGTPLVKIDDDGAHILYSRSGKLIKVYHLGGGHNNQKKWNYSINAKCISGTKSGSTVVTSTHFLVPKWNSRQAGIQVQLEDNKDPCSRDRK